jgi:hypothetical protein
MGKVEVIKIHHLLPLMEPQQQEVVQMGGIIHLVGLVEQFLVHILVVDKVVMVVLLLNIVLVEIYSMQEVAAEQVDILVMVVMVVSLILSTVIVQLQVVLAIKAAVAVEAVQPIMEVEVPLLLVVEEV